MRTLRTLAAASLLAATLVHAQILPAPPASPAPVVNYEYDAQGNPTKNERWQGGITDGAGAALFRFDLTSECKCGIKINFKGYVTTVAGGLGLKYAANSLAAALPRSQQKTQLQHVVIDGAWWVTERLLSA